MSNLSWLQSDERIAKRNRGSICIRNNMIDQHIILLHYEDE